MAVTDTWKKISTEALLKGASVPFGSVFIGLGGASFSVIAGDSPSGEIVGSGYERVPVQWTDFVANMKNSNTLLWSVGSGWSAVGAAFVSDSFQGGAVLLWDGFTTRSVASGDQVVIDIGNFTLT
jgi:hypothetical protein